MTKPKVPPSVRATAKTAAPAKASTAKKSPPKRPDWKAIELEYVMGTMTMRELAASSGVNDSTLRSRATRGEWDTKRGQKRTETTKAAESIATEVRIDQQAEQNAADLTIAKRLMAGVLEMFAFAEKPQDLKALSGAAKDAQAIARLALGMTTDNTGLSGIGGGPLQLQAIPDSRLESVLSEALGAIKSRA